MFSIEDLVSLIIFYLNPLFASHYKNAISSHFNFTHYPLLFKYSGHGLSNFHETWTNYTHSTPISTAFCWRSLFHSTSSLCFVLFYVNCQVGVVSESAKSEDPCLRRGRHGKTLFYYNLFLYSFVNLCSLYVLCMSPCRWGGSCPL